MNGQRAQQLAWIAQLGLCAAVAALLAGWLDAPIHRPQDEGQLLVYPELVLRGGVPQRDFFASYPPGVFWLIAGAYQLFGVSLVVERAVGFAIRLGVIGGVYGLTRGVAGRAVAASAALASGLLLLPLQLAAYAWLAGLALLLAGLLCLHRATAGSGGAAAATAGVLAGLALLFRLDLALAALLASLPLLARADASTRRHFALGAAFGLVPLAFHVVRLSPLLFWERSVVEPVFEIGPLRRVALGPFWEMGFERARQLALLGLGVASVCGAAWRARRRGHPDAAEWASLAGLCVGLLPQALQRMDGDHVLYVACVAAALLPAALAALLRDRLSPASRVAAAGALVALAFALPSWRLAGWLASGSGPARSIQVERGGRSLPVWTEREAESLRGLADDVDRVTRPGQRLVVSPADPSRSFYNDLHLYFLFPELVPGSYYLEMNPGSADRADSGFAEDLERADWVILSHRWEKSARAALPDWRGSRQAQRVLDARFGAPSQHGPWTLLGRRPAAPPTSPPSPARP